MGFVVLLVYNLWCRNKNKKYWRWFIEDLIFFFIKIYETIAGWGSHLMVSKMLVHHLLNHCTVLLMQASQAWVTFSPSRWGLSREITHSLSILQVIMIALAGFVPIYPSFVFAVPLNRNRGGSFQAGLYRPSTDLSSTTRVWSSWTKMYLPDSEMWMETVECLVSNMRLSFKDKDYRDYQGFKFHLYWLVLLPLPLFLLQLLTVFYPDRETKSSLSKFYLLLSAHDSDSLSIRSKY